MSRFIYALVFGFTIVLFGYVSVLRNEPFGSAWAMAISVIGFVLIIIGLLEERSYYKRFKLHSVAIWGTDFN